MATDGKGIIIGIDLGTTYSVVAMVNDAGQPEVLTVDNGILTPSVVHFTDTGKVVVGTEAKNVADAYPDEVIAFAKNFMGQDHTWEVHGKKYRPEEVSAHVLRKLVQQAEANTGRKVSGVVVTVPAIFGEAERHATKDAAKIADIPLLSILNEPEAAAIYYISEHRTEALTEKILVLDLGGGTFDLTLMDVTHGERRSVAVLHTDGDRSLGGKLWDDQLLKYACAKFEAEHGTDPSFDPETYQAIRILAEGWKQSLSQKDSVKCKVKDGQTTRFDLTRDIFDEITMAESGRVRSWIEAFVRDVTEKGHIKSIDEISRIFLVGGSAKMPQVQNLVRELLGREATLADPDLAVAKGAALYGMAVIAGDVGPDDPVVVKAKSEISEVVVRLAGGTLSLQTRSTFALGTETRTPDAEGAKEVKEADGRTYYLMNDVLIERNTELPLPEPIERSYYLVADGQTRVRIRMLEGDQRNPDHCIVLGEGMLTGIPSTSREGDEIVLRVDMTNEGVISVRGTYPKSGAAVDFTLKRESGLDDVTLETKRSEMRRVKIE